MHLMNTAFPNFKEYMLLYTSISISISMQERNFCKFERAKQFGSYAQIR